MMLTLRTQQQTAAALTATSTVSARATATAANVSRRPVLSVRRRIINTPTTASEPATQTTTESTTTFKYNRLRSKPTTATATKAIMTTAAAETSNNRYSNNNKLKSKSSSASVGLETSAPATLSHVTSNRNVSNIIIDSTQKHHKFQAASYALRRQFQTRRLTTTASSASSDENFTDVPSTQNPLFKRRLTLISTAPPPRTKTTALSSEATTTYLGIDDDGDQVAKSSIQSIHFNQITEQVRPQVSSETLVSSSSIATTQTTPSHFMVNTTRRQLIPRPRRPQSVTPIHGATTGTVTSASSPPVSRRQQSRRRPHKYIEVYNRPPSKSALAIASRQSSSVANDYHNDDQTTVIPQLHRLNGKSQSRSKSPKQPEVILHGRGIIECLEEGQFSHPHSCRKFITCAKFVETGSIVGREYTCPKGHDYDGVSDLLWSALIYRYYRYDSQQLLPAPPISVDQNINTDDRNEIDEEMTGGELTGVNEVRGGVWFGSWSL
ncbi:hypothetical protein ACLKA6_001771 [Drosophila palustris]